LRRGAITGGLLEDEFDGRPAPQILGAANALTMFLEPSRDVQRDAGVETAVSTAEDVQAVTHGRRF
jgi:hypothetical protein